MELDHPQEELKVSEFDELFEQSIKEIIDSRKQWVIISKDGLSEANPGMSKLMGRYKEYFDDIKIGAYFRQHDYFFESLYAQFVKQKPFRNSSYRDEYIQLPEVRKRSDYNLIFGW